MLGMHLKQVNNVIHSFDNIDSHMTKIINFESCYLNIKIQTPNDTSYMFISIYLVLLIFYDLEAFEKSACYLAPYIFSSKTREEA